MRTLVSTLVLLAALAFAVPAQAAPAPCWKRVINDWLADGRIDRIYEDECYAKALAELPQDLEEYSSLADEIQIARDFAQRGQKAPDTGDGTGEAGGGAIPPDDEGGGGGGGESEGWLPTVLKDIGPKNADEVPIPLLVLGGIATLLMAIGAAGMVARRTAHRRLGDQPQR